MHIRVESASMPSKLFSVPHEGELRDNRLQKVEVKDGIALGAPQKLDIVVARPLLAAVRIDDTSRVSLLPLRHGEGGLRMDNLPDDKPSRIGFYVGYQVPDSSDAQPVVSAIARIGTYPGSPLTTTIAEGHAVENSYAVAGFKDVPKEQEQAQWFKDLNLSEHSFDPQKTRMISERSHKIGSTWNDEDLVVVPAGMEDLVNDAQESASLQFLVYVTVPRKQEPDISSLIGGMRGGLRGGFSLGYGANTQHNIPSTPSSGPASHLLGAFEIKL